MAKYDIKARYLINNWKNLSSKEIEALCNNISWFNLCRFEKLSIPFIENFKSFIYWDALATNPQTTQKIYMRFKNDFYMPSVLANIQIDEDIIMENIFDMIHLAPIVVKYQKSLSQSNRDKIIMIYELNK